MDNSVRQFICLWIHSTGTQSNSEVKFTWDLSRFSSRKFASGKIVRFATSKNSPATGVRVGMCLYMRECMRVCVCVCVNVCVCMCVCVCVCVWILEIDLAKWGYLSNRGISDIFIQNSPDFKKKHSFWTKFSLVYTTFPILLKSYQFCPKSPVILEFLSRI